MKQLIKFIIALSFGLLAFASLAKATCAQPSGTYVGSGGGLVYDQSTGALYAGSTMSLSVNFTTKVITDVGKNIGSTGTYSTTRQFTINSFSTTTCMGFATLNNGVVYSFTSANNGSIITFSYYSNNGYIGFINLRLDKV